MLQHFKYASFPKEYWGTTSMLPAVVCLNRFPFRIPDTFCSYTGSAVCLFHGCFYTVNWSRPDSLAPLLVVTFVFSRPLNQLMVSWSVDCCFKIPFWKVFQQDTNLLPWNKVLLPSFHNRKRGFFSFLDNLGANNFVM